MEENITPERDDYEDKFLGGGSDDVSERLAEIDDETAEQRAEALLAGLEDYELDEEDQELLGSWGFEINESDPEEADPVVAIVGRPNVGKSTIINRIIGRREAVVEDKPGVTRDRVSYKAEWAGKDFTLVDTGGWEADAKGIDAQVAAQAEIAVAHADVVLLVVDAIVGISNTDEAIVRMLRRVKKPILLVANKVDAEHQEAEVHALWSLGMGEPFPVSGVHGRGLADMLDALLKVMPEHSQYAEPEALGGPRRIALVGRPNVGKSSLLNKLAGEERAVVNDLAGTTRDPVDEIVELGDRPWRFVDTAGIRRRVHMAKGADFYASLRTQTAIERSEVCVVLLDVSEPISEQDVRIIQQVVDSGRALVLAFNKWDTLDEERRELLEREIDRDLAHVAWAPRVNISARTGWHKDKLVPALETALEAWDSRISTGRFNAFLGEIVAAHPHPLRGGKQPRILFGTQVSSRPPKFVLFTTGFLDPGYRRFIARRLRETFDFTGTPIEISMRVRERRTLGERQAAKPGKASKGGRPKSTRR
ncbi:ribosome biogenesis GTPase Der [Rothia amarae]|uniref:ribosome biogenesis GTPase Der n=1 Tax=Rothia amarae TaxID=169480 RepID=UPI003216FC1C